MLVFKWPSETKWKALAGTFDFNASNITCFTCDKTGYHTSTCLCRNSHIGFENDEHHNENSDVQVAIDLCEEASDA